MPEILTPIHETKSDTLETDKQTRELAKKETKKGEIPPTNAKKARTNLPRYSRTFQDR